MNQNQLDQLKADWATLTTNSQKAKFVSIYGTGLLGSEDAMSDTLWAFLSVDISLMPEVAKFEQLMVPTKGIVFDTVSLSKEDTEAINQDIENGLVFVLGEQ